jgi:hypothetical protein
VLPLTDTAKIAGADTRASAHAPFARGPSSILRGSVAAALAAGALLLASATSASAGTYVINNCPAAPGGNGDPGPWTVFGAPQNYKGSCAGGPGNFIGPLGGSMSPGSVDGVQVVAPGGSGITIREARIWWFVPHQSSGADTFALAGVNTGLVGEAATPLERFSTPDDFVLPSNTTELTLADYCSNDDAGAGCVFGAGENPDLELLGSQLTLSDTTLPSGSVTGGALVAGGMLSGIESLSYNAGEGSSGVRLVQLRVDGNVVAQKDYLASCPYTDFVACPPSVSDTISWNTASVADGAHALELIVESAAQNTSVLYDGTIHTQNAAEVTSLGALPGPGTGGKTALSPNGAGAPNGTNASEAADLRLGIARAISRSFARRALRLGGRLLDAQGHPIGGAALEVIQQVAGSGRTHVIANVRTRLDGTFAVGVAAGPSRTIDVTYRAFSGDTGYAAQAKIAEAVGAGVRLRISPRRTGSEGAITLAGTVDGPIPSRGVVVDLLVHYRGRWEPFRTPRTDSHGRFRVAYQFQGGIGRFPFRAEVLAGQASFPYSAGDSQVVDVFTS